MAYQAQEVLGVTEDTLEHSLNLSQAHAYLEQHQITSLLQHVMSMAIIERPPDLREFLIKSLKELKAKGPQPMGLFTNEDLDTMFAMWDDQKVGTIPADKIFETLKAVNCEPSEAELGQLPWFRLQAVDKPTFVKSVRSEMEKRFKKMRA
eukprot:TRINITY_DN94980_c0_g1_i1.p1 TRINITY_DN94980_c0_g1~~TRINITY_DN94980_c0_g1_i1.p1  ORF type:complete len:150 (+),score=41.03 TRINITY_DN94980_c0_g1_i1:70-519(+)